MTRPQRNYFIAIGVFALSGLIFSAISTFDFIAHLDRQVHAITCSFIPGLGAADASGASGCHVVMMSPWSSVFRSSLWGGIPIALPAFAVFAYLLFRTADIWLRHEENDPDETRFLLAATGLPLAMTLIYFGISSLVIGALCKLCVGVYLSSLGLFAATFLAHRMALTVADPERPSAMPWRGYAVYFAEGVAFVLVPMLVYVAIKPSFSAAMGECGELAHPEDKYGVMVPLHAAAGGTPAIEVLDPLCPACRGFSQRLDTSGLIERLELKAVLFPLDKECNWMVSDSLHPGACAVSEAMLCAGEQAPAVLEWAFAHQEELRALAAEDRAKLYSRIRQDFPKVADCVDKPAVRTKLNKSLRWAVGNSLSVLTPQLYVRGQKVCDEDTDLGLEYVLTRMLDNPAAGTAGADTGASGTTAGSAGSQEGR